MKLNIIRNSVKGSALFLGMALLLCGCQNDEFASMKYAQSDAAVRFAPSIAAMSGDDEVTKATLYNTTGDDTHKLSEYSITEFQVAAWEGTSGTTNFIPVATKVKYITAGEGGSERYWSAVDGSGNIKEYIWKSSAATKTFFAWANLPASGASLECTSAASQTLTLTALPDKDILMGLYQGDGSTGSPAKKTGTASIHFYHPLTAVQFKKGTLSEGVSITGISIEGIYTSGKTTQTSTTDIDFAWTKTDGSEFASTDETGIASLSDVTVDGDGFIGDAIVLIPETFASDTARIVVTLNTPTGERTAYYLLKGKSWAAGCTNVITIGYDNSECIRFSAPTAHSISLNFTTPAAGQSFSMQYSTDAATWTDYTSETGAIGFGPSNDVYFRGKNPMGLGNTYVEDEKNKYRGSTFQINGDAADVTVSGDIMSLIDYEDISVDMPACAFVDLFNGCTALKTANNLQLSAETLNSFCYYQMFMGCIGLKNAPELFSENLAAYCYSNMFYGCTSLKKAPMIHATEVKTYCFSGMFQGCTSLNDVQSNLYAEELVNGCYDHMFSGCTCLKKAPVIHATKLATNCCQYMFWGCTGLENVQPSLPVETMAGSCYSNMFSGCTSLKTAPVINVKTLASNCFQNMFYGCTSLENVQSDLEPKELKVACYSQMFFHCTSLKKAPVIQATKFAQTSCFQMFRECSNLEYVKLLAYEGFDTEGKYISNFMTGVPTTGTFVYNHELGNEEAVRNAYTYIGTDGQRKFAIPDDWTLIPDTEE